MRKLIYAINMSLDGCCDHTVFTPCEEMYDLKIIGIEPQKRIKR